MIPLNEWSHVAVTYTTYQSRGGWKGAWDAFKAALQGMDPPRYPEGHTIELWVKPTGPEVEGDPINPKFYVNGVQVYL